MDPKQEESEMPGFLGMCGESIKIISSRKKIFFQIILTLILPLLLIYLSHSGISMLLITDIVLHLDELSRIHAICSSYEKIVDILSIEYIEYWLTHITYSTFLLAFTLFSTSTVVYTISCVYSNKETTYKSIMRFAFKVWNRLMITLMCNIVILIAHNILTSLALVIFRAQFSESDTKIARAILSTTYLLYYVGFIYISVLWKIASVITVVEKTEGFEAIAKSKALIMGKMGICVVIFFEVNVCLGCIHLLFEESFGVTGKVGVGGIFLVLRSLLFFFGLVVQTVIYFTFESSVNNSSSMSNYCNVDLDGYVLLESTVVEIEQGYIVTKPSI